MSRNKLVNGVLVPMTPDEEAAFNLYQQDMPPPVKLGVRIYKSDMWRRATESEAEIIKAGLALRPVREQEIFATSSYISPDDPLFLPLMAGFVAAFGQTRANELLAPAE
jgi:hypothetical protein